MLKTFDNAHPDTDDVVLCHYCGGTLHAHEDDVFWENEQGHTCEPMLKAEIVRLRAGLAEIEALSGGGHDFSESGAVRAWEIARETLGADMGADMGAKVGESAQDGRQTRPTTTDTGRD